MASFLFVFFFLVKNEKLINIYGEGKKEGGKRVFIKIILPILKFWNITDEYVKDGANINNQTIQQYNKIADAVFGLALPILIGIGVTICVIFAILAGIKMAQANSAEDKQAAKKKLLWNALGVGIIVGSQVIIPLIARAVATSVF